MEAECLFRDSEDSYLARLTRPLNPATPVASPG
jgi:hypothetical protein